MHLLVRWLILAIAIGLTAWLLPGMEIRGNFWTSLIIVSAVYGLVNAIIRPIVLFFSCPLIVLTLGLFVLIVNALMLSLTGWLLPNILTIDSFFWTTIVAALIISLVSSLLNLFVYRREREAPYTQ